MTTSCHGHPRAAREAGCSAENEDEVRALTNKWQPATPTESSSDDEPREKSAMRPTLIVWFGAAIVIWAVSMGIAFCVNDWPTSGQFGDSFGAVNALFSGLAFAGIIVALYLQMEELRLQRKELKETKDALHGQLLEMKVSRQLQSQPIAVPGFRAFLIQPPELYSNRRDEVRVASRGVIELDLVNQTHVPAVSIVVKSEVIAFVDGYHRMIAESHKFFETVTSDDSRLPYKELIEIDIEVPPEFFNALDAADLEKRIFLRVSVYYKNILGGAFRLVRDFRLQRLTQDTARIRGWMTAINHCKDKIFPELLEGRVVVPGELEWEYALSKAKEDFNQSLGSNQPKQIGVAAAPVAASFAVSPIEDTEYHEEFIALT